MPEALVGYFGRQDAENTDYADSENDWDLKAAEGAGTLAGAPRLSLPTYL